MKTNDRFCEEKRGQRAGFEVKVGLSKMLCGGVILDVTSAEEARIAEQAGAVAVMALERVPADIRREGGVARMAAIERIVAIQAAVSVPVMATPSSALSEKPGAVREPIPRAVSRTGSATSKVVTMPMAPASVSRAPAPAAVWAKRLG